MSTRSVRIIRLECIVEVERDGAGFAWKASVGELDLSGWVVVDSEQRAIEHATEQATDELLARAERGPQ